MANQDIPVSAIQNRLYSAICQMKILSHAFDAVWIDGIGEDEANGFTEGFSEIVEQLEDVSERLVELKQPIEPTMLMKVVQLQA